MRSRSVLRCLLALALALALALPAGPAPASNNTPTLPAPGSTIKDCAHCPELVVLPTGRLMLGTPAEFQVPTEVPAELQPVAVRIDRPIAIGRFEVTRAEYSAFTRATGRHDVVVRCRTWVETRQGFSDLEIPWHAPNVPARKRQDHPATCVDWHDAQAYVAWLSETTGKRYRLPSEVEWEYAAKAGTQTLRPWGNAPEQGCSHANAHDRTTAERYPLAWTLIDCADGHADVAPVGQLRANAFGVHDMLGNVWEWVEDCASLSYVGRPVDQRAWTWQGGCSRRIQRGGGWITGPERTRSAFHGDGHADDRADFAGLRVVREIEPAGAATPALSSARAPSSAMTPAPGPSPPDCADCPAMLRIEPGSFAFGSAADAYEHSTASGETPALAVQVRRAFALGQFEVTRSQFARFLTDSGHRTAHACARPSGGDQSLPAVCLTRVDVEAYLQWLRARTGLAFRLPSETEWEYAARAGTAGARFWSPRDSHEGVSISRACDYANVHDVSARDRAPLLPHARCTDRWPGLAPIGLFKANAWGLHDVVGNARERVADCYTPSYKGRPADERAWLWDDCALQVVRGGSYRSRPFTARSAAREFVADDATEDELLDVGFRVALDLAP